MKVLSLMIALLFPLRCPVCDDIVIPFGEKICLECIPKLRYVNQPRCYKCGKKLENAEQEYCADCMRGGHRYIRGRALYQYDSAAPGIYRFKYSNRQEYADFYGEEIAFLLKDFITSVNPDGLIPVPLHRKKLRHRGYNQAGLLAQAISRYTKIPVYDKLIKRQINTMPLKQLNPAQRQNNLKKAFNIIGNDVKLNTVIIIDDIYTTGSTIDEISSVLLEYGITKIYFITLACGKGV